MESIYIENKYLFVKQIRFIKRIPISNIISFSIENRYLAIHYNNNIVFIEKSLSAIEAILPSYFYRINRSTIINIYHCQECLLTYKHSYAQMDDGSKFIVSRRRYKGLQNIYYAHPIPINQPLTE